MQESFLGWKVLTSNEAKEMGLYKCGFCKKREKDPTESVDDFIERMNSEKEEY